MPFDKIVFSFPPGRPSENSILPCLTDNQYWMEISSAHVGVTHRNSPKTEFKFNLNKSGGYFIA